MMRDRSAYLLLLATMLLTGSICCDAQETTDWIDRGEPERGRQAIRYHGCASCHTIPGVRGADGLVGPSLEHIASRAYIGGVLPNTPDNLVRWILDPPGVDPQTAMPDLHLSERDARDIAGYLYTLK